MAQVFLNHKTEDKKHVNKVRHYLAQCLVSSWLDSDDMPGGSMLTSSISKGISDSRYFLAFISYRYLQSNWCIHELEKAYRFSIDKKVAIIPVLLDSVEHLKLDELESDKRDIVEGILQQYKYIEYDQYDPDASCSEISHAIGRKNLIEFSPIKKKNINGVNIQLLEFSITAEDKNLPSDFIKSWKINIQEFIGSSLDDDMKTILTGTAVAISGPGPNWLYAFISTCFKNLCPVYIYNNRSGEYICVYNSSLDSGSAIELGGVLRE